MAKIEIFFFLIKKIKKKKTNSEFIKKNVMLRGRATLPL